ncbi:kinetochore-associated protein Dsn1/Mis13, partial [Coniella lustricola]
RAIEDQLLKDFGAKSEFSDWFSRDEEPSETTKAKRPVVIKPNPINVDHERRISALEARIKQLKETRKSWRALQKLLPQTTPLYPPEADAKTAHIPEPDFLDNNEVEMLQTLIPITTTTTTNSKTSSSSTTTPTSAATGFSQLRSTTASRLRAVQNNVEFKVDSLADSIHKMDLRVVTAGRQAERVLALSSERLREREEAERRLAGTKEMPVIEVLRSLGRILPENGG